MILVRKTNAKGNQGVFLVQGGKVKTLRGDLILTATRPKELAKLCEDTVRNRLDNISYEVYDWMSCGWTCLATAQDITLINQHTEHEDIQEALDSEY